ncbi:MAG: recombinase RecA [Myxococcota bacterium]
MKKELKKVLHDIVDTLEKKFGKGALMSLDTSAAEPIEVIPSGAMALDEALGVGGYPRGRIVEVFGPESSGKTTLTLHAIAECQKAGGVAAFIDAEHAFDPGYAQKIGVDLPSLLLSQPDSGEQALEIAETLTRTGEVDLVVIDSVAALVPQAEIDGDMGDTHVGLQARLMSQALRKLTSASHRMGTTLIFINQLRQKIGVTFGNPETTPGGNALKFYSSVRLDVRRIGQVKAGDGAVGSRTKVRVIKNKCAPPFQIAEFDIRWGTGIDTTGELLDQAIEAGVVDRRGSHLSMGDEKLGQGREKARQTLIDNEKVVLALRNALNARRLGQLGPEASPTKSPPRATDKPKTNGAPAV